jgi:hypothetical protein
MSEETKRLAAERAEKMRAKGYVSVQEAAELVSMPRSNIYHWVAVMELGVERLNGVGKGSVFVSLADLKKKVPGAFADAEPVVQPARVAPRKLRRARKVA